MITQAIGLGLVISLIFSEVFGLAAGGMVVPGYVALELHKPLVVIGTVIASLITYLFTKFLSNFMFLYGRRRFVLNVLIGFLVAKMLPLIFSFSIMKHTVYMYAVGLIIPGLVANWMEQQGVFSTLYVLFIAASIIRILLIIISGGTILL